MAEIEIGYIDSGDGVHHPGAHMVPRRQHFVELRFWRGTSGEEPLSGHIGK